MDYCNLVMEGSMKNLCGKMRSKDNPYEVWVAGDWEWHVLKKWQVDDDKPYARWFCLVKSPFVPYGEMGDVYVSEIKSNAVMLFDYTAAPERTE